MNPQVEAAWIAGSSGLLGVLVGITGTVVVARIGFRSTTRSIGDQIEADRRSRIWEKQAATYADAVTAILHRQRSRRLTWRGMMIKEDPDLIAEPVDWPVLEGRVAAFGSPTVKAAFEKSGRANSEFTMKARLYRKAPEDKQDLGPVQRTSKTASDLDDALIDLIRVELHAGPSQKPEPVLPLIAPPRDDK
jgi:hypothetical protein